jgi:hypothetical protein
VTASVVRKIDELKMDVKESGIAVERAFDDHSGAGDPSTPALVGRHFEGKFDQLAERDFVPVIEANTAPAAGKGAGLGHAVVVVVDYNPIRAFRIIRCFEQFNHSGLPRLPDAF